MTPGAQNTEFVMGLLHQLQRLSRSPFYGTVSILKIKATPDMVTAQLQPDYKLRMAYPDAELKKRDGQRFYEVVSDGYRLVWSATEEESVHDES